jgi:N-methylhydantoinase A
VPPNAGVGSALGFFTAPRAFDLVRSHKAPVLSADFAEIESLFREMEAEGERTLQRGGAEGAIEFSRSVDARFIGQGSETNLPIPESDFTTLTPADVRRRFDETYSHLYGRTYLESPVEFVNFRVRASLPVRLLELPRLPNRNGRIQDAIKGERQAFSGLARNFIPFTVYDRYKLFPGAAFSGPAIVEERESTSVLPPGVEAVVDEYANLLVKL